MATRAFKGQPRVQWKAGFKPVAHPHDTGVVFMSVGQETHVIWDGETRPQLVFTGALEVIK